MNVVALHGILGLPGDWGNEREIWAPNLFTKEYCTLNLWDCARHLNKQAEKRFQGKRILLGYSMGGRLALHMLLNNPTLWSKSILISTHPGLKDDNERKKRVKWDARWAKRFKEDVWEQVIADWNSQDVFKGSFVFDRKETDYDRECLGMAFSRWSLGLQDDLSKQIEKMQMPIHWIVGENDKKFVELAQEQRFAHPESRVVVVKGAGHRPQLENWTTWT